MVVEIYVGRELMKSCSKDLVIWAVPILADTTVLVWCFLANLDNWVKKELIEEIVLSLNIWSSLNRDTLEKGISPILCKLQNDNII